MNVVPGVARFTIDARHDDEDERRRLVEAIVAACARIARGRELRCTVKPLRDRPAVHLDTDVTDVLRNACHAAGIEPREMPSGAVHDAQIIASRSAVGILFVPSIGGRSHRSDETTAAADIVLGTRVLATALQALTA